MSQENQYHYQVIRRAIDIIDGATSPLGLEELSEKMGMSPAHFQRTFSAWTGISPKRYQQYLMLGHAKSLLRERHTLLDVAGDIGLSGTSRLHDMFITWEAMSPGEFANGGRDLTIYDGWFDSPFGKAYVLGTAKGICGMAFSEEFGTDWSVQDMRSRWPNAQFVAGSDVLDPWVQAAFKGRGNVPLHFAGSPLQIKVWEALLNIPSGQVTTYSDIATRIQNPKATRAVGTAVGRNPISWIIPCHRALRRDGALGGYHWGVPIKRAMLAFETARFETTTSA